LLEGLKISLQNKNNETLVSKSKEKILVRDNAVDFHITLKGFVKYIILEGEIVKQLCSLWISG
ncbi:hypothetical protein BgiMline_014378, partial [Biomphalaria glabrata]